MTRRRSRIRFPFIRRCRHNCRREISHSVPRHHSNTFAGALNAVYAASSTWSTNPTNGDWNNPANWTPHTVPNGPSDVARFSTSTQTEISLSAPVTVAEIIFNTDVSSYNITCAAGTSLTFTGFGIHRIAEHTRPPQTFTVAPAESAGGNPGALIFTGESAGTGVTIINNGGTAPGLAGGTTTFKDSSFPGEGTLIANGGTNGGGGGIVQFLDHAIGRRASVEIYGNGGTLIIDTSSSVTELQSIAGDGEVILSNTLRLGFPGMGGTFSGVISVVAVSCPPVHSLSLAQILIPAEPGYRAAT